MKTIQKCSEVTEYISMGYIYIYEEKKKIKFNWMLDDLSENN